MEKNVLIRTFVWICLKRFSVQCRNSMDIVTRLPKLIHTHTHTNIHANGTKVMWYHSFTNSHSHTHIDTCSSTLRSAGISWESLNS